MRITRLILNLIPFLTLLSALRADAATPRVSDTSIRVGTTAPVSSPNGAPFIAKLKDEQFVPTNSF